MSDDNFTDEQLVEIRQRIAQKKAARKRNFFDGHNKKIFSFFYPALLKAPKQTLTLEEIEILIEMKGGKYSSAGPATSYGVREGYLERIGRGLYRATGKPFPTEGDVG